MTAPAKTTLVPVPATAAPAATTGLVALVVKAWTAYRNRRQVMNLLQLDEHMLRDLGLARGDVFEALSDPLLTDPSGILATTASQRRMEDRARMRESLRSAHLMDAAEQARAELAGMAKLADTAEPAAAGSRRPLAA